MTRHEKVLVAAALLAAVGGCATTQSGAPWVTVLDKSRLAQWNRVGDANWRVEDGVVIADKGVGYLVSKAKYTDFELRAEFHYEPGTNSGIYVRCQDAQKITDDSCYEANIYDERPKPEYGTGAITNFAAVDPMPKFPQQWNTYYIVVRGDHMAVYLNGKMTAEVRDKKFGSGVIALQHGKGVKDDLSPIRFRRVEIRPL